MGPVQLRRPSLETDALQPRPISSSLSRTAGWVSVMRVLVVCDEKGQGSGLREWGRSQRPTSRKPRDVWHPAREIKGKIKSPKGGCVESHPCAQNAQGWGTLGCGLVREDQRPNQKQGSKARSKAKSTSKAADRSVRSTQIR